MYAGHVEELLINQNCIKITKIWDRQTNRETQTDIHPTAAYRYQCMQYIKKEKHHS